MQDDAAADGSVALSACEDCSSVSRLLFFFFLNTGENKNCHNPLPFKGPVVVMLCVL